jgi:hypothetical protein
MLVVPVLRHLAIMLIELRMVLSPLSEDDGCDEKRECTGCCTQRSFHEISNRTDRKAQSGPRQMYAG